MTPRSWIRQFLLLVAIVILVTLVFDSFGSAQSTNRDSVRYLGVTHAPSSNTQATITVAAQTRQQIVAHCISATFVANASLAAAVTAQLNLRDGATGAGTILQSWQFALPAVAGSSGTPLAFCPDLAGTRSTAMTLEFAAAGGANSVESVALSYTVQ